jgi:hypothetical protein
MTDIAEAFKKERPEKKEYLQNELKSLGIVEPDHLQNEPIDKEQEGLQALAESIKSVYYQAYKTAYSSSSNANNNSSDSRLANSQMPEKRK